MEITAAYRSICPQFKKKYVKISDGTNAQFLPEEAAVNIVGLRLAPLAAVVTHKVRIINDHSSDSSRGRGEKGGLNCETVSEESPLGSCGHP